jgi:acetyl-CoA acetyltransferase
MSQVLSTSICPFKTEAVGQGARAIRWGEAELVVPGGVESMSRAPFVMEEADSAFARDRRLEDSTVGWRFVNPRMQARHGTDSNAQTAENLAS